jgi:hypothetical protein
MKEGWQMRNIVRIGLAVCALAQAIGTAQAQQAPSQSTQMPRLVWACGGNFPPCERTAAIRAAALLYLAQQVCHRGRCVAPDARYRRTDY